jgi:hypothetical protein
MRNRRKVRVKVYVEPKENSLLTSLAKVTKKSKSALIRSCIEKYIEGTPSQAGALKLEESLVRDVPPLEEGKRLVAKS